MKKLFFLTVLVVSLLGMQQLAYAGELYRSQSDDVTATISENMTLTVNVHIKNSNFASVKSIKLNGAEIGTSCSISGTGAFTLEVLFNLKSESTGVTQTGWTTSFTIGTITYDANGGTGGPGSQRYVTTQSTIFIPNTKPTLNGKTFQGWTVKRDTGTIYQNSVATSAITGYQNGAGTLYARWYDDSSSSGGSSSTEDDSGTSGGSSGTSTGQTNTRYFNIVNYALTSDGRSVDDSVNLRF